MLLFVLRLLPFVEHFGGEWRRSGRNLEYHPAVLRLDLGKAPRSAMDQIGRGPPSEISRSSAYFLITGKASSSMFRVVLI
jgi:hypothetical protein